jgi:phosphonate transport system substrate-binding protein
MGIVPRMDAVNTIKHHKPIGDYLAKKLGREVKVVTGKDFDSFWDGVTKQKYDIVFFNQYDYIESHKKYGYDVFGKIEENGQSTIAGALVVHVDSGITKVSDLKGKKVVFGGGKRAMQAYITATWMLRQGGLKAGDYVEEFSKNPPNAVMSVFYNKADAAGTGDKILELKSVTEQVDVKKLKFLIKDKQAAHLPWAVKKSMDADTRKKVVATLTTLKASDEGKAVLKEAKLTNIVPATDKDYDHHRKIVRETLGVEF